MKRTLMTLALVAAAGAAGAQTVTTPPVGGATVTPPSVGGGAVTTPPVAPPAVNTPAVPSRSVGAGGATVTTPPVSGGTVQAAVGRFGGRDHAGRQSAEREHAGRAVAVGDGAQQANAPARPTPRARPTRSRRSRRDGYKNVQGLTRNPDGSWSGKALRGGAMVDVQVDARGNVITK